MSLPLHTHGRVRGVDQVGIFKVLERHEAAASSIPADRILIWDEAGTGYAGSIGPSDEEGVSVTDLRLPAVVRPGDVIRLRENTSQISVLYRRGSRANTLFVTEQCNSRCLMCSQPPRDDDDSWRIAELLQLIPLCDRDEVQLGVSGGEPTLLGESLAVLLEACASALPDTTIQVLTNGRLFSDRALAERLALISPKSVVWAVPVYGDLSGHHDRVVASENAFDETMQGLFELGRLGARVEVRVVLHRLTTPRLPQLASFIYRRLPFVEHVALMGLEPMGFAKGNRDLLWIDPVDYMGELEGAVFHLSNRGIETSIYNLPLCVMPPHLRPFARQSISDWKNVFAEDCEGCAAAADCSGFFISAGPAWRSRAVGPIPIAERYDEMA